MTTLTFTVRFHQPFLVRSGESGGGLDAVSRPDARLPASSIKGAMRAAAQVIGFDTALVEEVFGAPAPGHGSAWAWGDAGPAEVFTPDVRVRNRLDPTTHTTIPEALTRTQEIWHTGPEATFTIDSLRRLEPSQERRHRIVLQASAYAVTALGSSRNRGMGTVTIRPENEVRDLAAAVQEVLR